MDELEVLAMFGHWRLQGKIRRSGDPSTEQREGHGHRHQGHGLRARLWLRPEHVAVRLAGRRRKVSRRPLFDHVGCGGSDWSAYDIVKYASLDVYADDIIAICRDLQITGGVFVGHSVSAMIGVLAAAKAPELFDDMVLIGLSPRYVDDTDYVGGFSQAQIHELLDFLDANHMGWSQAMAPVIMGNPERPELGEELTNAFA